MHGTFLFTNREISVAESFTMIELDHPRDLTVYLLE